MIWKKPLLCSLLLPLMYDLKRFQNLQSEKFIVIVISPLIALMQDQVSKKLDVKINPAHSVQKSSIGNCGKLTLARNII